MRANHLKWLLFLIGKCVITNTCQGSGISAYFQKEKTACLQVQADSIFVLKIDNERIVVIFISLEIQFQLGQSILGART